ncbi:MAG: antA/AntB antirepressor family protein [gamma proteobacterium endosymbiont of Lamellibrachia anaximandri]|nr:antA/AntB antirepressor family protein [gamma proteobacterium endosymbiont of Lamellibrachia anaximandri]MBL3619615.1 antA/AntB antirepressor family protein [gamma proteobacterium endosymbiont of Lamellibrachia anaximandri]
MCIKKHAGDRRSKDYWLTLDMAKMLGMLENNDKGDQVRNSSSTAEKQLQAKHKQEQPTLPAPVIKERILLRLENGQAKHTTTIPDTAYIATPDQLPEVVAKALPGMILVDRNYFTDTQNKIEGVLASLF